MFDNLSRGDKGCFADLEGRKNFDFVDLDITDEVKVREALGAFNPQVVINAVRSKKEPEFIKTYAYGNYVMLEATRQFATDLKRYIYLSSGEIYGDTVTDQGGVRPSVEEDALRPQSPVVAAQAGADLLTQSYSHRYQMPTVVLRTSNIFGPYQTKKRLIPLLINNALQDKALPLYGEGTQSKNWLYIEDFVRLLDLLVNTEGQHPGGKVYNVAGQLECTVLEVSELVLAYLGKGKELIEFVEDEQPQTLLRVLSTETVRNELGWEPETDFKEALGKTIEWYQQQFSVDA